MTVTLDAKERALQEVAEDLRKIQRELYGPGEPAPRSQAQPKEQEAVKRLPWAPPLMLE